MADETAGGKNSIPAGGRLSPWEWLPAGLLAVLGIVLMATPGESGPHRFALYACLGLAPGVLWRLTGRSAWTVHRVCLAVVLVACLFANPALRPAGGEVEKIIARWRLVALGFLLAASQPLWGALRLRLLLAGGGTETGFFRVLRLCLTGSFFNIFLPGATGGDFYRIYALSAGERRRAGRAVAVITLDRFLGMPPQLFLVLLAALLDRDFAFGREALSEAMTFIAVAAAACLALLACLRFSRGKRDAAAEPDGGGGRLRRLRSLFASHCRAPAALPLAFLYSLLSHAAAAVACACFGSALGVAGVPPHRYFLLVPLAGAINAIPGAPGGIGQGEIAMAALLDLAAPGFGNAHAGVAVMLLMRLANVAVGLAGGVCYVCGGAGVRAAGSGPGGLSDETNPCP